MNRQDSLYLVFHLPNRWWKKVVCAVLGVQYNHISLFGKGTDGTRYVIDHPKNHRPRVLDADDFLGRTQPFKMVPVGEICRSSVPGLYGSCLLRKNLRWPSLRYQIRKRLGMRTCNARIKCNCTTGIANLVDSDGWYKLRTPDEVFRHVTQRIALPKEERHEKPLLRGP